MSDNLIEVKKMLYEYDDERVREILYSTDNSDLLYLYSYNYNWDNGFEIPTIVMNNVMTDLSTALLLFYRADGIEYLLEKEKGKRLVKWSIFISDLYERIIKNSYRKSDIGFTIPLTKVQIFKLKKSIEEIETIFITEVEGKNIDTDI